MNKLLPYIVSALLTSFIFCLHVFSRFTTMINGGSFTISNTALSETVNLHKTHPVFFRRKLTTWCIDTFSEFANIEIGYSFVIINFFFLFLNGIILYFLAIQLTKDVRLSIFSLITYYLCFSNLFIFFPPVYTYDEPLQFCFILLSLIMFFKKRYWSFLLIFSISIVVRESSIILIPGLFLFNACFDDLNTVPIDEDITTSAAVYDTTENYTATYQNLTITVKDIGEIKLQLFPSIAPNTVNSFVQYILDGEFTDNEFHRVVNSVLIQGGRLENTACPIAGEMSANDFENDLLHTPGVISMARIGTDLNSATSQFFILLTPTPDLDGDYAPFGGVVSGFHIIEYIASLQIEGAEVPITTITISSITIELNSFVPQDRVCYVEE